MKMTAAHEEAIGWLIRLRDPVSADWLGFTDWLEAAPANREAYDVVVLADADMVEAARTLEPAVTEAAAAEIMPANDNQRGFFRRFGGIAAALLVAAMAWPAYQAFNPTYSIETALGEQRSVTLEDGTVIDLNGGTHLTLDRRNPRLASVVAGEAQFRVTHDPQAPFTVRVGGASIVDVGTVFNIAREGKLTEVSVAEGSVIFNPEREALLLKPGQRLRTMGDGAAPVVNAIDPKQVGGWKAGRLDFVASTLADAAPDLARSLGQPVSVDPAIADREFTGTILVDRTDKNAIENVAALMGVSSRRTGDGWHLTAN